MFRILAINPGSTSTRISVHDEEAELFSETMVHTKEELAAFRNFFEERPLRENAVFNSLKKHEIPLENLSAVVGRGAPLKPLEGGTYRINEIMLDDLRHQRLQSPHISVLAGIMAFEIAEPLGIPAFIADPVSTDEMHPLARISGLPEIHRKSLWHALNCKAAARKASRELAKKYEELNLIVCHLGSGITVSAHRLGRAIDVNNANSEGPFSPERAGTLPAVELIELCFSRIHEHVDMLRKVTRHAGLSAYLGTSDAREIERLIRDEKDEKAALVYEAMAYQVAKEIGAMATVLEGRVDAVVLTGALARSEMLTGWLKARVGFIAQILIYPGEDEMEALSLAALRVLRGEESPKEYS